MHCQTAKEIKSSLITHGLGWIFLISTFMLSMPRLAAQPAGFKEIFTDAEYYLLMDDYQEALPLYQKLYKLDSTNSNIHYRLGQCYLNISGKKQMAIPFLEMAAQSISPKYVEGSYRETKAPLNALFYLGQAYMINMELSKALNAFTQFRENLNVGDIYNLDYVNQQIKACQTAASFLEKPLNIKKERFVLLPGRNVSISYPVFSGDRQSLVFTVKEKFYTALYHSVKTNGEWGTPSNITLDLGVEGEVYSTSLNHDGTKLLIFINDMGSGNIYISTLEGGKWQLAKKFQGDINSRDWETFASYSADDKYILFTSNRKGGVGGLDIYISELLPGDKVSPPSNLGEIINTPYNEESPILSPDGNTLYFASQGHNSMGGYDIFYSKRIPNGQWSNPVNIGYPINTPDDEYFYFPFDSSTAVMPLASNGESPYNELYQISINPAPPVRYVGLDGSIYLTDNSDIQSADVKIIITSDSILNIRDTIVPSKIGKFTCTLTPGTYRVEAASNFYSMEPVHLYIPRNFNQEVYPLELKLQPKMVAEGAVIKLQNILFDFDSYALTREAKFELEKVFNLMAENPSLYIEVTGHTDSKGSPIYNLKLSAKRASAVVDYLVAKGIDERRFIVRGLESLENLATNTNPDGSDNPAGRQFNRRASIRIFNPDKKISIEYVDVPEHLKPINSRYTILLAQPGVKPTEKQISEVEKALDMNTQVYAVGSYSFICIGSFSSKSDAIESFGKVVDLNFPQAVIINENELQRIVRSSQKQLITKRTIYTILVVTCEKPLNQDSFKGFPVTEEKGEDGLYRYYFGIFDTRDSAKKNLDTVNSLGFPNAIIVKLEKNR